MKRLALTMSALLASAYPAFALPGKVVGMGGSDTVFVWRDKDAHNEALSLIEAGVHRTNPDLIIPLISCVVPSGTAAITTDIGFVTHDIMIVEGDNAGCRGNIAAEEWD